MVHIDWGDLELAFRDATGAPSYLDRSTGEVVCVVDGFSDADQLRELIAQKPERFTLITPIDAAYSREVMGRFLGQLRGERVRPFAEVGLGAGRLGAGGLTKCLALLRHDESLLAEYYRFEQTAFWGHVEAFLNARGVRASSRAPSVDLFEGLSA